MNQYSGGKNMNKLLAALLASSVLFGSSMNVYAADAAQPMTASGERTGTVRQAVEPSHTRNYVCPSKQYINCMPPIEKSRRDQCNPEFLQWVKGHCPGVKVVY